jgi:hypothetical protein
MLPFITESDVLFLLFKGPTTTHQLHIEFQVSLNEIKPVSVSNKEWNSRFRQLNDVLSRLTKNRKIFYDRNDENFSRGVWKLK